MRIIFILFCLLLPLQAMAQSETQPSGTIAVEDSRTADAAIATRIRNILAQLDGYGDVTVIVSSGIVTLRGRTLDAETAARLNELVGRVEGVVAIENKVVETTDLVERLDPAVARFRKRMEQTVAFLPLLTVSVLVFICILALGWLIAKAKYPWDRIAPNAFIASLYRQLVMIFFTIGGLVVALDVLNATALLSTILGAAGIIGLAIGFAVRDTVENYIASIMLSIRQPFSPNDAVEINGDTGKVIRLTSRATILLSYDGNHIRIPNATVFKSRIVNFSRNDERRFKFEIGVDAADADLSMLRRLAEETVAGMAFTLTRPAPSTWIDRIGDGSIVMIVTGWINQRESSLALAKGEAIRQVMAAIDAAGFEMPNTTYRLELPDLPTLPVPEGKAKRVAPSTPPPADRPSAPIPGPMVDDDVTTTDAELERIVDAERMDPDAPDLLDDNAKKE